MQKPDFNGPGRELRGGGHLDESVYCVNCGTIFVSNAPSRVCPSCTNVELVEDLEDRLEELEEIVDERLEGINNQLSSIENTTSVLAEVAGGEDDE